MNSDSRLSLGHLARRHDNLTAMVAYEELVVALTNWRINQGLPTGEDAFAALDTGSVDLELPVADPVEPSSEEVLAIEDYEGIEEIDDIDSIVMEQDPGTVPETLEALADEVDEGVGESSDSEDIVDEVLEVEEEIEESSIEESSIEEEADLQAAPEAPAEPEILEVEEYDVSSETEDHEGVEATVMGVGVDSIVPEDEK